MIKLYGFGAGFGVADPSPFVFKVNAYLRMAELDFEEISDQSNLRKAPKGKLPFIDDDGEIIADSFFIMEYLNKKYDIQIDQWMSAEQKSTAYHISKSLEEGLYWCLVYSRWMRDDTWPLIRDAFFSTLPFPLKFIVPPIARASVNSALKKQGLGKHSDSEIQHIFKQSLDSLSVLLGDNTYFMGDNICSLDATTYPFLAEFILADIDNPFNKLARSYANLKQYCERMQAELYENKNNSAAKTKVKAA